MFSLKFSGVPIIFFPEGYKIKGGKLWLQHLDNIVAMQLHIVPQMDLDLTKVLVLELQQYKNMIIYEIYQLHYQLSDDHATLALVNKNLEIENRGL